ncbi:MAG: DNA mismatch repair protein MutS, partial [Desulfobacterales bacterium]
MSAAKPTPMIQQYLAIKARYPDAILFYRMGDFYEMFFEDAERASQALEITLTSRNKQDKAPSPMCGGPFRAANGYIARLIDQGFKVAICDQVEDPAQAKGLVKREVVRVVTPGMLVEDELLNAKRANYVLALAHDGDVAGIAYVDISTGKFRLAETDKPQILQEELARVDPREILLPADASQDDLLGHLAPHLEGSPVTYLEAERFRYRLGRERLMDQFQVHSLEGFGCDTARAAVGAAGALLDYIQETQKQSLSHLDYPESYSLDNFLVLDEMTCRNLEILVNLKTGGLKGSLLGVMDATVTAMGGRLLKQWFHYPLRALAPIRERHEAIAQSLAQEGLRQEIREALKLVADLERLGGKLALGHGNARDLLALKVSLRTFPEILAQLNPFSAALLRWPETEEGIGQDTPLELTELADLVDLIEAAIREDAPPTVHEGGLINPDYDPKLAELITLSRDGKNWLVRLEAQERTLTGINALKVRFNKVFGYYIEVPKARSAEVPEHYVRKQTLVNAERYITDELKQFEFKVMNAEQQRAKMELALFQEIRQAVLQRQKIIAKVAQFMARIDVLLGLATVAAENDYRQPTMNSQGQLTIEEGRHPVVEKMISGERFVPNSVRMDDE